MAWSTPTGRPGRRRAGTNPLSSRRLLIVWIVLLLAGLGLVLRLVTLQVQDGTSLREKARQQQMVALRPFIPRRQLVDRNGTVLAVDKPVYTLFAHPFLFDPGVTPADVAAKLSPILEKPIDQLTERLSKEDTSIQLEYWMSEDVADRINRLNINGLEMVQQQRRLYPQQELMAEAVGYVNVDHEGQAGVEYAQQKLLERDMKPVMLSRDGHGSLVAANVPPGFLNADQVSVQLTLDTRLQRVARYALRQQLRNYRAKRGAVLVMDATDGSILVMASEPTYNPNQYYNYDVSLFRNWTVTDLYEPGSTFKPVNVAIALEAGAIKPDTTFYDEGQISVGGWPIQNFDYRDVGPNGEIAIPQILERSSNVGMVHIIQQLEPEVYYGWLERLGLGQTTGIDLPFESSSQIKAQDQFTAYPIEPATTAFGQGFSLTPIQLAQFHSMLANGGRLVVPHVVRGLLNEQRELFWQPSLPPPRQIFSTNTAQTVVSMMQGVVDKGTGRPAYVPGYRIAGKTGTAQKAAPDGGYMESAKITSFVAIFPAEAPRYTVLAVIDEPQGEDAFGSTVAAPIVKALVEAIITSQGIPPSHPDEMPPLGSTPTPGPFDNGALTPDSPDSAEGSQTEAGSNASPMPEPTSTP
ncbi:penicillin-binding protein 2 [Leptolyngbya sp. FACHB-261]|uniref:peptidoglycan D,D-transpeptidase FtsI family protein n=1 Tax=Leptolyngbya sp. FACHB-261 TaxID=2692806 RepID=UPI0016893C53|nr:penicillin-binding protein 2 [Leptolyngbya sp. FACHB-261]MBD2103218.1 penicillin-binding protein 2 [Leptolyngbya sp. FACHB-261]